jgi:uncharacterized protein YwgA
MFDELLTPLLLSEKLGKLHGKTRFQKLVFLVQKEAENKQVPASSFNYEIYHYGPFSSELSETLEKLKTNELLDEDTEITANGYTRFVYHITRKGQKLVDNSRKKGIISNELENIISKIACNYGEMPLTELVAEAYHRFSE